MNVKWDSKKLTAFIIYFVSLVGLLVTEACTPNQDLFGENSTLALVIGLAGGFAFYIFGQSIVDAIKEIAKYLGEKWLEKKSL